jgi:hypothetical protein
MEATGSKRLTHLHVVEHCDEIIEIERIDGCLGDGVHVDHTVCEGSNHTEHLERDLFEIEPDVCMQSRLHHSHPSHPSHQSNQLKIAE